MPQHAGNRTAFHLSGLIRLVVLAISCAASLPAQSYYGTIRGSVRDPNGSAWPNTKVSLIDEATNVGRATFASADGEYAFNQVIPATYSVIAEATGFKKFERKGVIVATQQQITLDLALEVGDVTQTVQVTAEVPLVETANASQGQVLDAQRLAE